MKMQLNKLFYLIAINVLALFGILSPIIFKSRLGKFIEISVLVLVFVILFGTIYYKHKKKEEINYKAAFFVTILGIILYTILQLANHINK